MHPSLSALFLWSFFALTVTASCRTSTPTDSQGKDQGANLKEAAFENSPDCKSQLISKVSKPKADELRMASFNVENLFDTIHDEGKLDFEYTPAVKFEQSGNDFSYVSGSEDKFQHCNETLEKSKASCGSNEGCIKKAVKTAGTCLSSNWDDALYTKKLSQLKVVFQSLFETLPDVLVLVEVENVRAVSDFAKVIGYGNFTCKDSHSCTSSTAGLWMTTEADERGINVAVIYRKKPGVLEFVSATSHDPEIGTPRPTRHILEANFRVDGNKTLTVFGNHWPSQGNPTDTRINAAKKLKSLMNQRASTNSNVIALGDFNVAETDKPRPIEDVLLAGGPSIYDLGEISAPHLSPLAKKGSYYFGQEIVWNHLDRMFFMKSLKEGNDGLTIEPKSYRVHHHEAVLAPAVNKIYRNMDIVNRRRNAGENIPWADLLNARNPQELRDMFANNPKLEVVTVTESCAPKRFDKKNGSGFSDHIPLSVLLKLN